MRGTKTIKKKQTIPEGYKQTAVGIIPKEWEVYEIGKLVSLASGGTPSRQIGEYWNGNIPWITTGLIKNGIIDTAEEYITELGLKNSSAKIFPAGTILMAMYGQGKTRGSVAKLSFEAATNQACAALMPRESTSRDFLFYYLKFNYENIRNLSNTGNQENLSLQLIRTIKVKHPPLPEQQKIAAILSTWDEAIEKTQSLIDQLRQRNKGLAQQLLTGKKRLPGFAKASASKKRVTTEWKVYSVAEIFDFLKNASFSRDNLGDGNFYYLHYGDIHVKFRQPILKVTGNETIPRLKYEFETSNNFDLLQNGDVVIADASEDTEGIGDCIEIQNVGVAKVIAGLHTIALRDSMGLTAQLFRGYYFKSDTIRNQLRKLATGISVYGISKTSVKKIRMILPPKPEQEAIAQVLEQANEELHLYEQKLVTLQFQKKGLMQKLLTGELRVKTNVI